jgi:hypothetical protein
LNINIIEFFNFLIFLHRSYFWNWLKRCQPYDLFQTNHFQFSLNEKCVNDFPHFQNVNSIYFNGFFLSNIEVKATYCDHSWCLHLVNLINFPTTTYLYNYRQLPKMYSWLVLSVAYQSGPKWWHLVVSSVLSKQISSLKKSLEEFYFNFKKFSDLPLNVWLDSQMSLASRKSVKPFFIFFFFFVATVQLSKRLWSVKHCPK